MPNQNNKTGINSDEDEEDISCDQPPSSVSNRTTSELETTAPAEAQAAFEERIRKKLTMPRKRQKSSNTSASPPQNTTKETPPDNITTSEFIRERASTVQPKSNIDQPSANNNSDTPATSSGLQQIEDDNNDLPLPMGMAEVISNAAEPPKQIGQVEQIEDDDVGPEPPAAMLEASLNAADPQIASKVTAESNNLASVNDEQNNPPVPFNSTDYEDDDDAIAKKMAKDMMKEINQKPAAIVGTSSDSISMHNPPITNENEEDHPVFQRQQQQVIRRPPPPSMLINPRGSTDQPRTSENSITTNTSVHEASSVYELPSDNPTTTTQDDGVPTLEATLVPDIPIYDATPVLEEEDKEEQGYNDKDDEEVLPWYKRHKRYLIMGVVVLVVIVMISVMATLFVDLYKDKNKSEAAASDGDKDNDQSSTPPPTPTSIQDASSTNSTAVTVSVTPPAVSDMPIQSPTLTLSSHPSVSLLPTTTFKCFGADDRGCDSVDDILGECARFGTLGNAVRAYVDQDCANNEDCDIGQTYGWPMNSWCVGSVTYMTSLFQFMETFNENISDWNTSSVTDMRYMFARASSFNGNLTNFDTSSVTTINSMFRYATSFNQDLSNFDTSSVTDMYGMFAYASSFNQDLSNFDTSSVTSMYFMFEGASLFNGDLSNFDTSKVTDLSFMFAYTNSFNQDVSSFDTSSVTDMRYMFYRASLFNQDLCSWRDSFPYTADTADMFTESGCAYQDTPTQAQKGPFCASDCQYLQVVSSASSLLYSCMLSS